MQASPARPGRVLITGANGHLGRLTIARLARREGGPVPVRAVVRSERAAAALRALPEAAGLEIRVVDYRDEAAMRLAAADCDVAVHLVGILREGARSRYSDAHEGTSRALAGAADAASLRRIVYLSILGSDAESENACLASKGRAERILLAAKTPVLVLRVPMVLGPGDFATRALRGQARSRVVPLLRGGASLEQPIDAEDVVSAIVAGIDHDDLDDVTLDLAGPESLSRRDLLMRCAALCGGRPTVIPIPRSVVLAAAGLLEALLPDPPLSRAMVGVLDHDDDVPTDAVCARLGIQLTPLERTLERYVGPGAP